MPTIQQQLYKRKKVTETCNYEKYINEQIDKELSVRRAYKQEIKLQFQMLIDNYFYDAVNQFIDEGNEYTSDHSRFAQYLMIGLKKRIDNT
jgi:hypothetical protein